MTIASKAAAYRRRLRESVRRSSIRWLKFGQRAGDFDDDFVEVQPGFLIDPLLRLCIHWGGIRDLEDPNRASLIIGYDPEIDPNRLLVPPSERDREIWRMSPVTAHRADVPKVFRSDRYDEAPGVSLVWSIDGDRIRYKIENDVASFALIAKVLEVQGLAAICDDGRDTLLYAISSAPRLTALRAHDFRSSGFATIKSAEVWILSDVLVDYFKLPLADFRAPEPGWVILSSREIVR